MLYYLLKPIVKLTIRIFFKKIYFTNAHLIPKDKPVMLAANHPTAFIEPCIVAALLEKELHFLVRGDLFKKPFYRKLLMSLKMIPIFRFIDGYSNLKNNTETFEFVYQALYDNKIIMILAEGKTIQEKRLRPIKKGAARMSFRTWEKFNEKLDIHIVPLGVNYTQADQFRSDVMIEVGEPIKLRDYEKLYEENDKKAIRQVTADLAQRMTDRIVNIPNVEDEALTESLFELQRNDRPEKVLPMVSDKREKLLYEQNIANTISNLEEEKKTAWYKSVKIYFDKLKENEVSDFGLRNPNWYSFKNTLILIIGFVPFVLGAVLNALPAMIADHISKNKVKQLEFKASVKIAVAIGGFLIYYIIGIIIGFFVGNWMYWVVLLMMPFWGYVAIIYKEFYDKWKAARAFHKLPADKKNILLENRKELTSILPSSMN